MVRKISDKGNIYDAPPLAAVRNPVFWLSAVSFWPLSAHLGALLMVKTNLRPGRQKGRGIYSFFNGCANGSANGLRNCCGKCIFNVWIAQFIKVLEWPHLERLTRQRQAVAFFITAY